MNIVDLPLNLLVEAIWNPNTMDAAMLDRLTKSIDTYGLVSPFVVRQMGEGYEILNGNQRRQVVEQTVDAGDAHVVQPLHGVAHQLGGHRRLLRDG